MDEKMREMKEELTETRKDRDALRERLRLSASMDQAQKIALIRALQECASVLGLDDPSPAVLVESITALHARTRTEANPWRYPSRGELPDKRRRSYEVSVSFDGAANVWHSRWDGKRFDLGAVVYAWREMAEPAPPLEPEGEQA